MIVKHSIENVEDSDPENNYDLVFKKYKEKIEYVDREIKDYEDVKEKLLC